MATETRTCHVCGTVVSAKEFCPICIASFEHRRPADEMTGEEREIEMRRVRGPLEIPFELVHQRVKELVGRPVFIHEMGSRNWQSLVDEASHRRHPTLQEVLELIPEEKRLVVNPEDPEDMMILMDTLRQHDKKRRPPTKMSFAQLYERRRVKLEELVQTFEKYARSGAGINARVVHELIYRVRRRIGRHQLKRLAQAAAHGANDQATRGHKADAAEYQKVLDLVQRKLAR